MASEHEKDPDENKTIPDQLYKIAEEAEGSAAQVLDQVEISINSFDEIGRIATEMMSALVHPDESDMSTDDLIMKLEDVISYAENGKNNLDGILDIFQYQDIVRQKLEKVGHQLIDVSDYIRRKLMPKVENLQHLPPSGKDILDRNTEMPDSKAESVDDIIAEFLKNKV